MTQPTQTINKDTWTNIQEIANEFAQYINNIYQIHFGDFQVGCGVSSDELNGILYLSLSPEFDHLRKILPVRYKKLPVKILIYTPSTLTQKTIH